MLDNLLQQLATLLQRRRSLRSVGGTDSLVSTGLEANDEDRFDAWNSLYPLRSASSPKESQEFSYSRISVNTFLDLLNFFSSLNTLKIKKCNRFSLNAKKATNLALTSRHVITFKFGHKLSTYQSLIPSFLS